MILLTGTDRSKLFKALGMKFKILRKNWVALIEFSDNNNIIDETKNMIVEHNPILKLQKLNRLVEKGTFFEEYEILAKKFNELREDFVQISKDVDGFKFTKQKPISFKTEYYKAKAE
jgi:hypothetical protein